MWPRTSAPRRRSLIRLVGNKNFHNRRERRTFGSAFFLRCGFYQAPRPVAHRASPSLPPEGDFATSPHEATPAVLADIIPKIELMIAHQGGRCPYRLPTLPLQPGIKPQALALALYRCRPTCRQIKITGKSPIATITKLGTAAPFNRSSLANRYACTASVS